MQNLDQPQLQDGERGPIGLPRLLLLAAIALAGAALCGWQPSVDGVPDGLLRLGGAALCGYALLVVLAWFPMPWLSRRIEAQFEDLIGEGVGAWYLAVALGSFAIAEWQTLVAQWMAFESIESSVRQAITDRLIGFSIESFMNLLWAALWPIKSVSDYGPKLTAAFAAVIYALVWLGQRVFGESRLDAAKAATE